MTSETIFSLAAIIVPLGATVFGFLLKKTFDQVEKASDAISNLGTELKLIKRDIENQGKLQSDVAVIRDSWSHMSRDIQDTKITLESITKTLEKMIVLERNQQTCFARIDDLKSENDRLRVKVHDMASKIMVIRSKIELKLGVTFDNDWDMVGDKK